jgi:hypothetical protein
MRKAQHLQPKASNVAEPRWVVLPFPDSLPTFSSTLQVRGKAHFASKPIVLFFGHREWVRTPPAMCSMTKKEAKTDKMAHLTWRPPHTQRLSAKLRRRPVSLSPSPYPVILSTPANARTRVPVIQSRDDPSTLMATVTLNAFLSLFWKAYLPIENTLNGKRPRLVHRPRAGPAPRVAKKIMVRCHAWVLLVYRRIYQSTGVFSLRLISPCPNFVVG